MKIIVPTSWSDVTIKQFQEIAKVPELGFDEWDTQLKILEILTGIPDHELYKMQLPDLKKIILKTSFINQKSEKKPIKHVLKVAGQRYRINYEVKTLTTGEYIDMQEYLKEGTNVNLHKILAIYMHPINIFGFKQGKYYKKSKEGKMIQTLESRERTSNLILDNMKMSDVFPISSFFLNLWGGLIKATQVYLAKQLTQVNKGIIKELSKEVS